MKKMNYNSMNIAGIQLAIFELIWPTFRWIDYIYMSSNSNVCVVCIQSPSEPSDMEWSDCCMLLGEILEMAFGDPIKKEIVWQKDEPASEDFIKIMSPSIFEEIAREVDPSRLASGR